MSAVAILLIPKANAHQAARRMGSHER